MKVLIVKLTSMGDVIHTLPALTDAVKAIPGVQFDWVVDESFAEVPTWHPAVNRVIKAATRRWRKHIRAAWKSGELKQFLSQLRVEQYDVIIDAQSNFKSAIITRLAKGMRCGYDAESVREKGAHWFYQKTVYVSRQLHAVTRIRKLFAKVLDYPTPIQTLNFGLDEQRFPTLEFALPENYIVCIPNTSWESKHWLESHWKKLIQKITATNTTVLLPWHSEKERKRVQRIAKDLTQVNILPRLSLSAYLTIMKNAKAVVSCDTGLAHLASAFNKPLIGLYGPTDPKLIGVVGDQSHSLLPKFECVECYKRHCHYSNILHKESVCMQHITPDAVMNKLEQIQAHCEIV